MYVTFKVGELVYCMACASKTTKLHVTITCHANNQCLTDSVLSSYLLSVKTKAQTIVITDKKRALKRSRK